MAEIINFLSNTTVLMVLIVYIFAIWFGLVIWTWVDISRRTQNWFYRYAMVLLVAFGAFVGFAFYLMIRPALTLKEIESQKLEEHFLLSSSSFSICSNCGEVAAENFLYCTNCATKLKNECANCKSLLNTSWSACPVCGRAQEAIQLPVIVAESEARGLPLPKLSFNFAGLIQTVKKIAPQGNTASKNEDDRKTNVKDKPKKKRAVRKARVSSKTA